MWQNCKILRNNADPEEYHGANSLTKRGDAEWTVSSGMLREFAGCAARWLAGYQSPESESKDFGSLFDCLLLTPSQFDKRYAVRPETYKSDKGEEKPWNNNATVCRDWNEAAQTAGQKPIKRTEFFEAQTAVASMKRDKILSAFLDASDRQVWITGQWKDDKSGMVVPCQALIDALPRKDTVFGEFVGDVKTTRNAAPGPWQRWSSQMSYNVQAAMYLDMVNEAAKEQRHSFVFVLLENYPPWQTGRRLLSQQKLKFGQIIYQSILRRYCQCLKTNTWPTYDDTPEAKELNGWTLDDAFPWDEQAAMLAQDDKEPEAAPETEEPSEPS